MRLLQNIQHTFAVQDTISISAGWKCTMLSIIGTNQCYLLEQKGMKFFA